MVIYVGGDVIRAGTHSSKFGYCIMQFDFAPNPPPCSQDLYIFMQGTPSYVISQVETGLHI